MKKPSGRNPRRGGKRLPRVQSEGGAKNGKGPIKMQENKMRRVRGREARR